MEIIYKNSFGEIITLQQTSSVSSYSKHYIIDGELKKIENFYDGIFENLVYFKAEDESHQEIMNAEFSDEKLISIREIEIFGDYRLEKDFVHNELGVLYAQRNVLYNSNDKIIGHEWIENSVTEFDRSRKYYYDLNINPNNYLFECTYDEFGNLFELEYNNFHIDPDGQESIILNDASNDISTLVDLTGITQTLIDYYLIPDVTPNF